MDDDVFDLENEEESHEAFLRWREEEEEEAIESARAGESNRGYLLRAHQFHLTAQYVAIHLCEIPAVRRIFLFVSVALPLRKEKPYYSHDRRAGLNWVWHQCGDIDLAVWVDDLGVLKSLQRARSKALNVLLADHNVGVAHHQVDLFIMEPKTDRYLGRLCTYGTCPKGKPICRSPGCGETAFLRIHEDFEFKPEAIHPAFSIRLYDAEEYTILRKSSLLATLKG